MGELRVNQQQVVLAEREAVSRLAAIIAHDAKFRIRFGRPLGEYRFQSLFVLTALHAFKVIDDDGAVRNHPAQQNSEELGFRIVLILPKELPF